MTKKRGKTQERMQTQAKPSNRTYEKNMPKTIDNVYAQEITAKIRTNK